MQAIPEDIQILFGEDESIQANSEGTSVDTREHADWHQDQYPAYQPPHRRGHNVGEDKFVNFKNRDPKKGPDPDKVEGVDNDKYQRLKLPVPFALDRKKLAKLKSDFPGVYFHCKDNGNHDHQFSHVVTMIGTRLMQRRIKPGSIVLDVYGNANACDRFNGTQANAANPKQMKALHFRCGPSDFIREVNKWGPFLDEAGDQRFHRGTLGDMTRSGELSRYNVLQFVHTLYYQDFAELTQALHSPCDAGTRVAYALIHRHKGNRGYINDGEQSYEKKTVFNGRKLVRQTNLATNSTYTHADLSDILFKQNKTWFPNEDAVNGLTWECHLVNEETWVIEIVPYVLEELRDDIVDYDALWDADEDLETETNGVETPPTPKSGIEFKDNYVIIPTSDGQTVRAEIVNPKLFGVLRAACVGKDRTRATLDELVRLAKHNVNPSAMFGDKEGMHCPEDKIFDHALAAYFVDLDHESRLMEAASTLRPVLMDHASKMNFGPKIRDFSIADLMGICRCIVTFGRQVNAVTRSKDPVDKGLEYLGNALA